MVLLLALAVAHDWASFKAAFGKTYAADAEEHRRAVFEDNVRFIEEENKRGHSFVLGVTEFSDLTEAEFVARMHVDQPPAYGGAAFLGEHEYDGAPLPPSVNWTAKGAVTPVKNQRHCGSCWAFSTTGALESAVQINSGKLVSLSEQQFVDCPHSPLLQACHGGSSQGGFLFAMGHALCSEASYPYEPPRHQCQSSNCSVAVPKGAVKGYKGLSPVPVVMHATEQKLMSALTQQPVSVAIEAKGRMLMHYKAGVFGGYCGNKTLGQVNHLVLAVGYGTDATGGPYWTVKNSWSRRWGEEGYIRFKRGVGGYGQCHILSSPAYPVVDMAEDAVFI